MPEEAEIKKPANLGDKLVCDELRNYFKKKLSVPIIPGVALCCHPFEMEMILDYTALRGGGSNLYYSYIFQVPKWDFAIRKVDEWMEITPEWAEYWGITHAQKQKLIEYIKNGLMSAATAVSDYELIAHDARRYREIIDYFKQAKLNKDEHILRSLFIDRVDVHTGEGYSMVTMARRWPTIISDFIKMQEHWTNVDEIRKKLDVSAAEASILKTKNELYKEWKMLFEPAVKERYARIKAMADARKKSIDEYKNWLTPYIAKLQVMEEKTSISRDPTYLLSNPYISPGFGQSIGHMGVKLWMWKPFTPPEYRMPVGWERKEITWINKEGKKEKMAFVVDPYDDFVKEWAKKIEKRYNLRDGYFDEATVREILKLGVEKNNMNPSKLYYSLVIANILLSLTKTPPPEAMELDNLMFAPIETWVISQNVMLLHLMELHAREEVFKKYIEDMIGAPKHEEDILKSIEKEFEPPEKPKKYVKFRDSINKINNSLRKINKGLDRFAHIFIKRGPYETNFEDRVTKIYNRGLGAIFKQHTEFLQKKMGVEGI